MGHRTKKIVLASESLDPKAYQLDRVLGPSDLILLGVGAIIGAGLFSITGIAAAEHAGPAIILSFLIAALGCTFAGLCYSELSSMIPMSGSAYSYTYATMGPFAGWLIGWTLVLEYAIGAATVAISWSAYVVSLLEDSAIHLPASISASMWQPAVTSSGEAYGFINLPAVLIIVILSLLLIFGVKESVKFNSLIVLFKLGAIALFVLFGFFYINYGNYHPFIPENSGHFGEFGISGIFRASGIVFFAYIGFDAVSTTAQDVKNPKRSLPIGILGSLFICTIIYIIFGFVLTGLVNYKELDVAAPVAKAVQQIPYRWLGWIINLAILAAFTSVILVLLFGQSRIFYAMSKDKMLPDWLSTIHPIYKTPWAAHLILMLFVSLIAGLAPLEVIGNMTSIGTLLAFVLVCAIVLFLRYRDPGAERIFKTPFFPYIPLAGIAICLIMMFSLEMYTWLRLIGWLLIGFAIYFGYSRKRIAA